jgi:hypothetical protein
MSEEQKIQQVLTMLGCSESEAKQYLDASGWDVLKAVESNVVIPRISGTQHIPEKPVVNDGLSSEVREKLKAARSISDSFTAALRNDLRGSQASVEKPQEVSVPDQVQELSVPELKNHP